MDKISIVLAAYNGESFIEEQLDSIRLQTRCVDEVIIYDDQSQDRTSKIIEGYIHKYKLFSWHLYKQKNNVGYIKNFATGLKETSGDIIFLCDQDDIWEIEKVDKMMKCFDKKRECLCINTSFQYIDKIGNIKKAKRVRNYGMLWNDIEEEGIENIPFEEILYHNISMGCTMAFRSTIKDEYLKQSKFLAPHDWEINRIAAAKEGLYFYNTSLIKYRIHENNTVGNDKENHVAFANRLKNAEVMYTYAKSSEEYGSIFSNNQLKMCEVMTKVCNSRLALLKENKKKEWLYLLCHYKIYHRFISNKGMVVDLLYKNK